MAAPPSATALADEVAIISSIYAPPEFKLELCRRCLELVRAKDDLRIALELPECYPDVGAAKPSVSVLGMAGVSRSKLAALNVELGAFVSDMHCEGECMLELLQVAMEKADATSEAQAPVAAAGISSPPSAAAPLGIKRMWFWFHFVEGERRKREIASVAEELGVWGVCKPGFPRSMFVEGPGPAVDEYVDRMRLTRWKNLEVRHVEEQELPPGAAVADAILLRTPAGQGALAAAGVKVDDTRPSLVVLEEGAMDDFVKIMTAIGRLDVFKAALIRL